MLTLRDVLRFGSILAMVPALVMLAPAPSRPAPPAPIDLAGVWSLDTYLSDHSEQIARAVQVDTGEYMAPEAFGRGAEPGADGRDERPERFGLDGRQGRERRPPASRMSADDRKRLAELTRPIEFPPPTLTIAQADDTVTITAGGRAADTLHTNGKAEKVAIEGGTVNRTATWEGPQLRVAYDIGSVGALVYTYSIVPTTKQLLVRINIERLPGQPGPFDIKLVYNRTAPSTP